MLKLPIETASSPGANSTCAASLYISNSRAGFQQ